nr:hypothetical protein [Bacteroidota bacterium]
AQAGSALIFMQEAAGSDIFWPAMNIQTFDLLLAGKSYFVKVSGEVVINFAE